MTNSPDTIEINASEIPNELPVLINSQFILYPFMIAPLLVQDKRDVQLVDDVINESRMIGVFAPDFSRNGSQREQGGFQVQGDGLEKVPEDSPGENSLASRIQSVGTVAVVMRMLKIPDGSLRLLVHGLKRARLKEVVSEKPYPVVRVETFEDINHEDDELQALQHSACDMLAKLVEHSNTLSDDLISAAHNAEDPGRLADLISSNLHIGLDIQQEILELAETKKRLRRLHQIMNRELDIAILGSKIQKEVKGNIDKMQREYFLREQIKAIRRELGEESEAIDEMDELSRELRESDLPENARRIAEKELNRLRHMSPQSAEYTVSRTYLDWFAALPWNRGTEDNIDLHRAKKILDEDHFALDKIKDRILDYLGVIKICGKIRGPILCLAGPPGVGKTSLGKSIARAMKRRFVRISLGGVRDEAEIRGHRRTYIGAMPGRIIKSMKDCDSINPVFMMDEIDKLGSDFRGDPASALLEVLDPEQNREFVDHYLDVPFDLSRVMFITTANSVDTIPGPLLDRMEVLQLSGYTLREKICIAKQYLVPRAVSDNGLNSRKLGFKRETLEEVIDHYTREAGLRNLEREINNICRKVARRFAEGNRRKVIVTSRIVRNMLGVHRYDRDRADQRLGMAGVATGLAWTQAGGDILFVEASSHPGKGELILTGQLGDVMKESAMAALSYLHSSASRFSLDGKLFKLYDLHIHVPAGAIPKDGPSAGITIFSAMLSLYRKSRIRKSLSMTGEITVKGAVLPVGGIKEKLLAAQRGGIDTVILPQRNRKDLSEINPEVLDALKIHFIYRAGQIPGIIFNPDESSGLSAKKK
jgi:ATP-dependent Lon protease